MVQVSLCPFRDPGPSKPLHLNPLGHHQQVPGKARLLPIYAPARTEELRVNSDTHHFHSHCMYGILLTWPHLIAQPTENVAKQGSHIPSPPLVFLLNWWQSILWITGHLSHNMKHIKILYYVPHVPSVKVSTGLIPLSTISSDFHVSHSISLCVLWFLTGSSCSMEYYLWECFEAHVGVTFFQGRNIFAFAYLICN